jgi:hypothetical protein
MSVGAMGGNCLWACQSTWCSVFRVRAWWQGLLSMSVGAMGGNCLWACQSWCSVFRVRGRQCARGLRGECGMWAPVCLLEGGWRAAGCVRLFACMYAARGPCLLMEGMGVLVSVHARGPVPKAARPSTR